MKHTELQKEKKPTKLELHNSLKNIEDYLKKVGIYEHESMFILKKNINKRAGEHQKTIWKILLDEVGCQTTVFGRPIINNQVEITKDNVLKLKKNIHNYARRYAVTPEAKKGGRPRKKIDMRKVIELKQKGISIRNIAKIVKVSHPTIIKILNEQQN